MYSYIIGVITEVHENYIVLENNNIGYKIFITDFFRDNVSAFDEYKVYTEFVEREDASILYGFSSQKERELFNLLTDVTSIGPKYAMNILSTMTVDECKTAIITDDIKLLTQAPGVGKKTASRIILELKEKIEKDFVPSEKPVNKEVKRSNDSEFAREALLQLGYFKNDVDAFIENTDISGLSIEDIMKKAMKSLDSSR
ncbi:Holliday junction branch migration protein RuvA [Finegoldia magna]|uniref:Holliday junction branch migration complex subunit RuvA n=2 Tax=Finegoldia magna TaxID=1260 RepID=RUVA_FINM2|nr:Holliday junction branch migration protein RuvA [Finegoldia magna]B0S1J4.1 RecName: Full=Holliday junction branch migration complex subunit RuvA [Finegoldia magna ATCC 29328]EFK93529.1 Holliday junction DNA helicase RuvA [Finegoldia magna ACS-171-V-Col3]EFL54952.1 Holliday junction DNA helicase RuvA [Finegoldia magna BVS033A4]EXF26845.1 ATP-dependent DNA helicase RuvA [Finegoldia magna ALB8]MBS6928061.1 Holliday junction branch migration protein RuvA [Finegoldia magna]MDU4732146.1 Holliday